jgi:stage III sporulation protein SpoIIIAA
MRCGVKIFASIHGTDLDADKKSPVFQGLLPAFEAFVTLAPIGKVVSVEYK